MSSTPMRYYDDLRQSEEILAVVEPLVEPDNPNHIGRNLHRVKIFEDDDDDIIMCHVPTMFRWTASDRLTDVSRDSYGGSAAVVLAIQHLNTGDGSIVPDVQDLHQTCPIRFTTELIDTHSSGMDAVRDLTLLLSRSPNDLQTPQPCALIGPSWSGVSRKLATVTGVYDLPQVTSSASSVTLDELGEYPLFARTHPSDAAMAQLSLSYLQDVLNVSHAGVLFVDNSFGVSYNEALLHTISKNLNKSDKPMTLQSVAIARKANQDQIVAALQQLQETGYNYFIGVMYGDEYEAIMNVAGEMGLAGPGKFWMFTGLQASSLVDGSTTLPKDSIAAQVSSYGNAIIHDEGGLPGFVQFDKFITQWKQQIGNDPEVLDYINSKLPPAPTGFDIETGEPLSFARTANYYQNEAPGHIAAFSYDAMIGIGLSACRAWQQQQEETANDENGATSSTNSIFTGKDHHKHFITQQSFNGASGKVIIGPETYSRNATSTYFVISNILNTTSFDDSDTTTVNFRGTPITYFDTSRQKWETYYSSPSDPNSVAPPFIYPDRTTMAPNELPELFTDLHLMGPVVRGSCLALAGIAIVLSLFFMVFSHIKRKERVILAAQPPFLIMICIGTLLMATSIIPATMDDAIIPNTSTCTVMCTLTVWFFPIGFCIAFSALFSKLWRINQLFHNATGFKRVQVHVRDVIIPFLILLSSNVIVLIVWTLPKYQPLWMRTVLARDVHGRVVESVGRCTSESSSLPFTMSLVGINGFALLMALWQAYLARRIKTEFSESRYIAMAMVCIFEACFIGGPVVYIVNDQPEVQVFLFCGIVFIVCMSILLLLFVPKLLIMRMGEEGLPRNYQQSGSAWVGQTSTPSNRNINFANNIDNTTSWNDGGESNRQLRVSFQTEKHLSPDSVDYDEAYGSTLGPSLFNDNDNNNNHESRHFFRRLSSKKFNKNNLTIDTKFTLEHQGREVSLENGVVLTPPSLPSPSGGDNAAETQFGLGVPESTDELDYSDDSSAWSREI